MDLTIAPEARKNQRMGRKPMVGASFFQLRILPEDRAYLRAVMSAHGLNDMGSAFRFAVREICRRDKLKVDFSEEGSKEDS
jgi:hypothetical protein